MRVSGKRVYLSGPMSGVDGFNVMAFFDAHLLLKGLGAEEVYDPAVEYLGQSPSVDASMDHAMYMLRSLNELTAWAWRRADGAVVCEGRYDALVQLPGWEVSEGARIEAEVAKACGIDVVGLGECE